MVPNTGFQGRKTAETDHLGEADYTQWYPGWLVQTTSTGKWTLIVLFCNGQTFFPRKLRRQGRSKRILKGHKEDGSKNEKLWGEQETAGQEGGVNTWCRNKDVETKVRPALQAGGRQSTSLSAYPGNPSRLVPFLESGLSRWGPSPLTPRNSASRNQKPKELFAISFFKEDLKRQECLCGETPMPCV